MKLAIDQHGLILYPVIYTPPHDSGGVLWFYIGRPCVCPSIRISFPDNSSKHQWMFTKFNMKIDSVEIWFGIAYRRISSHFELSAQNMPIFLFPDENLSKRQWIFTKLGMCIDIVEIWFGIANG